MVDRTSEVRHHLQFAFPASAPALAWFRSGCSACRLTASEAIAGRSPAFPALRSGSQRGFAVPGTTLRGFPDVLLCPPSLASEGVVEPQLPGTDLRGLRAGVGYRLPGLRADFVAWNGPPGRSR